MNLDQIKIVFQKISKQAAQAQVEVELLIDSGEGLGLSAENEKLAKFDQKTYQTAGFRVLFGGQQGYSSTENLSEESLQRSFQEAVLNAKDLASANIESVVRWELPDGKSKISNMDNLDLGEQGSIEQKIKMTLALESISKKQDTRVASIPYNSFSEYFGQRVILNSKGLERSFSERNFSCYTFPLVKQGEQTKMIGEDIVTRNFKDINIDFIAKHSVEKSIALLGAEKLVSGRFPVVIGREVAQQLFGLMKSAFSAKNIFDKKSPLADKMNQKIATDLLTINDDPFDMRGGGVRPFDAEGSPSQKVSLIEKGVLKNYLTNTEYAAKLKIPLTAHASRSATSEMSIGATTFIFPVGKESLDDLLKKHPKVIHLVELSAFHSGFKSTTGDFSLPGQGFLYENGKKIKPVDQFVMSGNIFEMLNSIEAFSNQIGPEGHGVICADVLIKELSFA